MSFLYPRMISVRRQVAQTDVGDVGYQAALPAEETTVLSDLPASIQFDRQGQRNPVGLPTDNSRPTWRILIPKSKAALGSILSGDIIQDDLANRYQVYAPYWNSLGYGLRAIALEA